jgi:hypothetical protein
VRLHLRRYRCRWLRFLDFLCHFLLLFSKDAVVIF